MEHNLGTPEHEKLREIIQQGQTGRGEMSVRPVIHRAILQLLAENGSAPTDIVLMRDITGHDPEKPNYDAYNVRLRQLSELMGTSDLYGGESLWTRAMIDKK